MAANVPKKELEKLLCKTLLGQSSATISVYKPRAKRGFTHRDRVTARKRKRLDMEKAEEEDTEWRKRFASDPVITKPRSNPNPHARNRTATQVVNDIGKHGMALHTLATRGDRRNDRQHERDEYNLLKFGTSLVGNSWTIGDADMCKLPKTISSVYDVRGWVCINTFADGRVVFKRPAAPLPARGCCAQQRKVR